MRLILIRHGLPDYETDTLKPEGIIQAEKCAERLKNEGISEIYSSPMGRAVQTATYTAEKLNLNVNILDFISEIHGKHVGGKDMYLNGIVTDITNDMVAKNIPLTMDNIINSVYFKGDMFCTAVKMRQNGIDGFLKAKGFIREGLYYRHNTVSENVKTVAVFSHCNAITSVLAHFFNIEMPLSARIFRPDLTGITVIEFPESKGLVSPKIEILNDTRHIGKTNFNLE